MENYTKQSIPINEWAEEDRPREKLLAKGRNSLTDAELIAILIGSGNRELSAVELSKYLLSVVENDLNALAKLTIIELKKIKGIGDAKALSIISALELGRRRTALESVKRIKISSSMDSYRAIKPHLLDLPHEEFWVLFLNRANILLKKHFISAGGITGTVADVRMIFKSALENLATSIILVHNHPSGNLQPSAADELLTKKLKEAGKLLDIPVLDHLIVTDTTYYSFADEGRL